MDHKQTSVANVEVLGISGEIMLHSQLQKETCKEQLIVRTCFLEKYFLEKKTGYQIDGGRNKVTMQRHTSPSSESECL
jgi:hypothetical protein